MSEGRRLGRSPPTGCSLFKYSGSWEAWLNSRLDPSFSPGIRSWDVDPGICNLDEQLKVFVSRHSATFSSIVKGEAGVPLAAPYLLFTGQVPAVCQAWGVGCSCK